MAEIALQEDLNNIFKWVYERKIELKIELSIDNAKFYLSIPKLLTRLKNLPYFYFSSTYIMGCF